MLKEVVLVTVCLLVLFYGTQAAENDNVHQDKADELDMMETAETKFKGGGYGGGGHGGGYNGGYNHGGGGHYYHGGGGGGKGYGGGYGGGYKGFKKG